MNDTIKFTVTNDHITLLKQLRMQTAVIVHDPDEWEYCGVFTCLPDINKKRPFGNSGNPVISVLEELGMLHENGKYTPQEYEYASMLLIELPLAYEAVMAHGAEPCTCREPSVCTLSRYGAWVEYKSRRAIEYFREGLTAAAALEETGIIDPYTLMELAMNLKNDTPNAWLRDFSDMAPKSDWSQAAYDAITPSVIKKWRNQVPDSQMSDEEILAGILNNTLQLSWPKTDKRPS